MIFYTSDTHWNHKNVLEYDSRPFSTIEEHDQALIDNWNKTVKPDDIVYHLGDVKMGKRSLTKELVDKLAGQKHLVKGNHDSFKHCKKAFLSVSNWRIEEYKDTYMLLIHSPWDAIKLLDEVTEDRVTNITRASITHVLHGHVHNHWNYAKRGDGPLFINVGTCVRGYQPRTLEELLDTPEAKHRIAEAKELGEFERTEDNR